MKRNEETALVPDKKEHSEEEKEMTEIKETRKRKNERWGQRMEDDRCEECEGMKVRTLP